MEKIANFHCDLPMYLQEDPARSAYDPESRTSLPHFKQGGVVLETLAIFVKTHPTSSVEGEAQFQIYKKLRQEKTVRFCLSIENASAFCSDSELLDEGLKRLQRWLEEVGRIAYISLTWNGENRFGGGCGTHVGLKEDGKRLLQWMSERKIAIDLSHTSDALAYEILDYMARSHLKITPVASHSNFRRVCNVPRNLPDELAQEVARQGGLIGLNLVRPFLGNSGPQDILKHALHAERIGVLPRLCFGADFFDDRVVSPELEEMRPIFLPGYDHAGCYPQLVALLRNEIAEDSLQKIAYTNLASFL